MRVRNDPVTVIADPKQIPLEDFWEGALGVNARVRRPAYFLSEGVLAEDENILTWKIPCYEGIVRFKKVRVKSDVDPAFFVRKNMG